MRAIIWDMDGTLVDTSERHFEAWNQLAKSRGLPFSRQDFEETFGRRNPEIVRQLLGDDLDEDQVAEIGETKEAIYREKIQDGVQLLPGVGRLLQCAQKQGFGQAVGSSAPRENVELILRLTQTSKYFAAMVSMEDCSVGKPNPQVFEIAAGRLKVQPERCVVMEDAVAGILAAKAAGMKAVAVTIAGHHGEESLQKAGADLVLTSLELLTLETIDRLF